MKLDKIIKELGSDTIDELNAASAEVLKEVVVTAEHAINTTKAELDVNPHYEKAKEDVKALSAGFREVKKRQNAKIQYALHRLTELGKVNEELASLIVAEKRLKFPT